MKTFNHKLQDTPPSTDLTYWIDFACQPQWHLYIRAAVAQSHRWNLEQYRHTVFRHQIAATFHNAKAQIQPFLAPCAPDKVYVCYDCGDVSASTSGYWHHRRQCRTAPSPYVSHAAGTLRTACGKQWHTNTRLLNHLTNSDICGSLIQDITDQLTQEQMQHWKDVRKDETRSATAEGHKPNKAKNPAISQTQPHPLRAGMSNVPPPRPPEDDPIPPPQLIITPPAVLRDTLVYVLNLFSGQRRDGDLQQHIETTIRSSPLPIVVLSLDIINDYVRGDLSNHTTILYWQYKMMTGWILALIGGPPCETWSVARFMKFYDRNGVLKDCPPPLRTLQHLWGKPAIKPKQQDHVECGNLLMRAMMKLVASAEHTNTACIMEHPTRPTWVAEAPSSWYTEEMQYFRSLPNVQLLTIDQCMLGVESKKPTDLLVVHFQELVDSIPTMPNQLRCNHPRRQHKVLRGVDHNGKWNTAPSKQYPRDMCGWIGPQMIRRAQRLLPSRLFQWDDIVEDGNQASFVPLDPFNDLQRWGAYGEDFADRSKKDKYNQDKPIRLPQDIILAALLPQPQGAIIEDEVLCQPCHTDRNSSHLDQDGDPITPRPDVSHVIRQKRQIALKRKLCRQVAAANVPTYRIDTSSDDEVNPNPASSSTDLHPPPQIRATSATRARFTFGRITQGAARAATFAAVVNNVQATTGRMKITVLSIDIVPDEDADHNYPLTIAVTVILIAALAVLFQMCLDIRNAPTGKTF